MRSKLRLFVGVGVIATTVDVGLFLGFASQSRPIANGLALTVAAGVSYLLNRYITFRDEPNARWVSVPARFALIAVVAGAVDMMVLFGLLAIFDLPSLGKVSAVVVAGACRWFLYRGFLSALVRREMADRTPRPVSDGSLALTIVVPAYNEAERIEGTIAKLSDVVGDKLASDDFEILVVNDGSSDDTSEIATAAGARVIDQVNKGKGAAIRTGMTNSRGRSVVFLDADLAYPAELVLSICETLDDGWDIVVGSRRHERTTTVVKQRRIRSLGGRVINGFTHLVLLGHFRDTQCGIKGFRGDVARSIFDRTLIDGFAFDVEVFLLAEQDLFSLTEIPVVVENRAGSSVSLVRDSLLLLRDLFRVRRWAGEGRYDPAERHLVAAIEPS